METKLTYENMYKLAHDYFFNFDDCDATQMDSGDAREGFNRFFTRDCRCRRCDWPVNFELEDWYWVLAGEHPSHRYDINIDPPYGYCVIDPESGFVHVNMREDVYDTDFKRVIRAISNTSMFHCAIEDGVVKFDRELITRWPGYYQIDALVSDNPREVPSFFCQDFTEEREQFSKQPGGGFQK